MPSSSFLASALQSTPTSMKSLGIALMAPGVSKNDPWSKMLLTGTKIYEHFFIKDQYEKLKTISLTYLPKIAET